MGEDAGGSCLKSSGKGDGHAESAETQGVTESPLGAAKKASHQKKGLNSVNARAAAREKSSSSDESEEDVTASKVLRTQDIWGIHIISWVLGQNDRTYHSSSLSSHSMNIAA